MVAFVSCSKNVEEVPDKNEPVHIDEVSDESKNADDVLEEIVETPNENKDVAGSIEEIEKPSEEIPEEPEENILTENISVNGIKLSMSSVSLCVGEKKMPIVTMSPQNATDKREMWTSSDTSVATVDGIGNIMGIAEGDCRVTVTSVNNPSVSATVSVTVLPEAELTYIDGILVVNKTYPLPASYAPGWETEASGPLWEMIAAAKKEGIKLWMTSGYRSYYDQQYIYNGYVKRDGQEKADTYSARPGHSEHQTGLAYDLNDLDWNFGETPEGMWIAENCHKYGFILRYPEGKEKITGYKYEPWHIRYLGVEKATEIFESGLCLEEFLNITSTYAEDSSQSTDILSVLEGDSTFIYENGGELYLKDFAYGYDGETPLLANPSKYALVDFNSDGVDELVIDIAPSGMYIVIHEYDGNFYGFMFGIRSLHAIKTDGTFIGSGGVGITYYSSLGFNEGSCYVIDNATDNDTDGIHMLNGKESTADEVDEYVSDWNKKTDVEWIDVAE